MLCCLTNKILLPHNVVFPLPPLHLPHPILPLPSFILDLTATPKENSNILSLVPAIELKKEHMVKLPVIVYNNHDKTEVINNALHLQRKLENLAIKQEKDGGKYIKPIVLFQAQPKTRDDNTTFEKLKEQLLGLGILENQIKIKILLFCFTLKCVTFCQSI